MLLDPSPLQERPVPEQLAVLGEELRRHSPALAARPRVVAVNKADLPEAAAAVAAMREIAGGDVLLISAVTGAGLDRLLHAVADAVEQAERAAPEREGFVLHRPAPPGFEVGHDGETWVVAGRAAERAVALADLTVLEAADYAARRLARLGVDDALRAAGARPGDEVRIGDLVFEFRADEHDPGDGEHREGEEE